MPYCNVRPGPPGGRSGTIGRMTSEDRNDSAGTGSSGSGEAPGPGGAPDPGPPQPQEFPDRVYRSPAAMAGGILLLAIGLWLTLDAAFGGTGSTPWFALAGLLFAAPLVVAFTLRPAVFAGERRLRVRNPFRTIEIPWGRVATVRSGYSSEVLTDGAKYQLWSIPVSLRARKKAARHNERVAAGKPPATPGLGGMFGSRQMPNLDPGTTELSEKRAPSDQSIDELRELQQTHGEKAEAQGEITVRWSFEILAPTAAGAVLLAILLAVG